MGAVEQPDPEMEHVAVDVDAVQHRTHFAVAVVGDFSVNGQFGYPFRLRVLCVARYPKQAA
ncbi:hypothetical protein GCM10011386_27010 [Parapedobacter defluvii]|uniref:Uncharacterized protein n=1 Tax=Parapedobacter defluvii TaxID=2045106 RepID=A0ABQ1M1Z0_9SPHI|nr:hypothetical protein GCM10011386_27010 [Parapedobacter defluvii]